MVKRIVATVSLVLSLVLVAASFFDPPSLVRGTCSECGVKT